jgi:AraC-like DNA-binding protein
MLTSQSATPDAVLRPFVQWYVQRETAWEVEEVVEPVFPRAGAMLIFQFAATYDVKEYETEQLRRVWAATVIGPISSRRTRLILPDHVESLDVLFRPLGLYRLFGVPIAPLAGGGSEGHAVFGPQISSLYECLGNATSFADRVKLLDSFFINRLQLSDPLKPAALAMRLVASGRWSVTASAERIGISERQLERQSHACCGVSPKLLARVSRFQRAIQKRRSGFGSWMDIAHEVGYYDQMHLIRDFHDLGGGTPTEVMEEIADNHLISFFCR